MKKGDIVSVVTVSGEYVGEYKDISPTSITLTNPKMIVSTPEAPVIATPPEKKIII